MVDQKKVWSTNKCFGREIALFLVLFVVGFGLFRLIDIYKPWPVSWADQRVKAGFGIMLDDILAALYAGAGLYLVNAVMIQGELK